MTEIRRLAVIGLGSMGRKHAVNAVAMGLDVAGVDPSDTVVFPDHVIRHDSRDAALAWCDAVVIASPSGLHRDDLAAAVRAGRPCLVEKPLADRSDGLDVVLTEAVAKGIVVSVAQNLRHHPAVVRATEILRDRSLGVMRAAVSIGASYLPDWRPGTDYRSNYAADPASGGVIFDWVHEIDMLAHLLGPFVPVGAVADTDGPLTLGADEQAGLLLRHAGGAISTLLLSYAVRPQLRRTVLMGLDGRIEINIPGRRLTAHDAGGVVVEDTAFGGEHADDYRTELESFIKAVAEGQAPRCPGREALDILNGVMALRAMANLPSANT